MDNLKDFFSRFFGSASSFWGGLTTLQKALAVGAVGLVGFALSASFALKESSPYEILFANLNDQDTSAIVAELKKNNVTKYLIDEEGIKVPASQVGELRLKLAQEGLPSQGIIGWEKFDAQDFTRTNFEQQINKLRAIQGELARTIMALDSVVSARVHIVTPKKSLFIEDHKEPTSAIYIKTKRGAELDKKQIKGIVHMVSRSVEGLKPNNVTIIDEKGNMLTEVEADDFASKMTKEMLAYKRSIERKYEQNIRSIVGRIVGPDRVEVKVDSTVDFTQEKQTVSDIDPDRIVAISKNITGYEMEGAGLNPTGIPGSKSNVPGEQEELSVNTSRAGSKKETELINYEVSKTISERTLPIGTIQHLSAAVIVDGSQSYPIDGTKPVFEARSEEEMNKIAALVKSTLGFKDGRDEVTVHNMMFQLDPYQVEEMKEQKAETREYISTLVISSAVAVALVLFFAFIVRPYFRWLSYDPQRKAEQKIIEEFKPELELTAMHNVQVKEDVPFEKLTPQEQVHYLAKHEPKRTTEAIRLMLNPHGSTAA